MESLPASIKGFLKNLLMVPEEGVEPHIQRIQILNLARLPIPPPGLKINKNKIS